MMMIKRLIKLYLSLFYYFVTLKRSKIFEFVGFLKKFPNRNSSLKEIACFLLIFISSPNNQLK